MTARLHADRATVTLRQRDGYMLNARRLHADSARDGYTLTAHATVTRWPHDGHTARQIRLECHPFTKGNIAKN